MFDKLESLVERLDTVLQQLNDPDVAGDQNRFRDLMKEQSDLAHKYMETIMEARPDMIFLLGDYANGHTRERDRKSTRLNSSH